MLRNLGLFFEGDYLPVGYAKAWDHVYLRGRWEKFNEHPLTICDTGHNLAGWEYLEPQIASVKADTKHIVFGMVDDKDVEHVMGLLKSQYKIASAILLSLSSPRYHCH